uniref:WD repeat-containing protein 89 n=1 Tax=Leptobrachium leishanense TaxID=445787 RepID=A0A8C5MPA5_9ANUR
MEPLQKMLRSLQITKRSSMENESVYVLDIDVAKSVEGKSMEEVAILCSNNKIKLYNHETMTLLQEYGEPPGVCGGVRFAHTHRNLLFSTSADGSVKSWDTRTPGHSYVQKFTGYPSNVFISFDISCNDLVVCAGTELVGEDALLVFWDVRSTGRSTSKDPLGVYSESHSDDVTQVRFHPTNPSMVASGSSDGLVNIFNVNENDEADALSATCNSDSTVSFLGWAGENHSQVFCLTHNEGFCWWDTTHVDTEETIVLTKIQDMRKHVSGCTIDYLIGGVYHNNGNGLCLAGGSHGGNVILLRCEPDKVQHLKTLLGGHSATVRSFYWDLDDVCFLTGGEDAQLLSWRPHSKVKTKSEPAKMPSALQQRVRVHKTKHYSPKKL